MPPRRRMRKANQKSENPSKKSPTYPHDKLVIQLCCTISDTWKQRWGIFWCPYYIGLRIRLPIPSWMDQCSSLWEQSETGRGSLPVFRYWQGAVGSWTIQERSFHSEHSELYNSTSQRIRNSILLQLKDPDGNGSGYAVYSLFWRRRNPFTR